MLDPRMTNCMLIISRAFVFYFLKILRKQLFELETACICTCYFKYIKFLPVLCNICCLWNTEACSRHSAQYFICVMSFIAYTIWTLPPVVEHFMYLSLCKHFISLQMRNLSLRELAELGFKLGVGCSCGCVSYPKRSCSSLTFW